MPKIFKVQTITDDRGSLSVLDQDLPFEVKRIFYIHSATKKRGGHGHLRSRTVLICVHGSVNIEVQSPTEDSHYALNSPDQALLLEAVDWHSMDQFSPGAVLLVLASEHFDKTDYFTQRYRD